MIYNHNYDKMLISMELQEVFICYILFVVKYITHISMLKPWQTLILTKLIDKLDHYSGKKKIWTICLYLLEDPGKSDIIHISCKIVNKYIHNKRHSLTKYLFYCCSTITAAFWSDGTTLISWRNRWSSKNFSSWKDQEASRRNFYWHHPYHFGISTWIA